MVSCPYMVKKHPRNTARVLHILDLEIQVQDNSQYHKANCQSGGDLNQRTFHGTSFILSPVGICHTADTSQSLRFSFLHQYENGQSNADNNKDNR